MFFCHLLSLIKSDEKKKKNIVKKHPIRNFMFTFAIIHQTHHYTSIKNSLTYGDHETAGRFSQV